MKIKGILGGIMAMVLAVSPVFAEAEGIGIVIDGEEFVAKNALGEVVEPFIEDGSTFLPVRAISEAFGKEVEFDAENYAVYIGEKPDEAALKEKALWKINGRVFYESDVVYSGGNLDKFVVMECTVERIQDRYPEEEINARANIVYEKLTEGYDDELFALMEGYGIYQTTIERWSYYSVCMNYLFGDTELSEDVLSQYVTVKHILTDSEDEAEEIYAALEAGADFDDLIEEYNQDPGQTRDSSYTFTTGEMVEEFEKAAFALEEGEYTKEAVESAYGYHIIKRLPLDESSQAVNSLKAAAINNALSDEAATAEVTRVKHSGEIDGIEITDEALTALDATGVYYEDVLDYYAYMIAAYEVCVKEGYLTQEEIAAVRSEEESLEAKLNALTEFVEIVSEKLQSGEIDAEEFEAAIAQAQAEQISEINRDVRVYVDGELVVPTDALANYVAPKNVDGTVYLPVRAIAEALGMEVEWDNDARCVVIISN